MGAVSEFSKNGTAISHAYLDSGKLWDNGDVQNYRAFRFNWTGFPNEEVVVVAMGHGESTTVYVSWNGETAIRVWKFGGLMAREGKSCLVKKNGGALRWDFILRVALTGLDSSLRL